MTQAGIPAKQFCVVVAHCRVNSMLPVSEGGCLPRELGGLVSEAARGHTESRVWLQLRS